MPKIIDHDAYRLELAKKAAVLFAEHGYTGLGMRKIATELGISKSALYHYFPSKQVLFHACTDMVTRFSNAEEGADLDSLLDAPVQERVHSLVNVIKELEPTFPNEMSLLLDYLRGRSKQDIASDPTMQLANRRYDALIEQFVDPEESTPVLCLLLGTLLVRFFNGGSSHFDEIEDWLIKALQK